MSNVFLGTMKRRVLICSDRTLHMTTSILMVAEVSFISQRD